MSGGRPALFLDRDGVVNLDKAYLHRREDFELVEGIFELCRAAKQRGYLIFVVTNQSGIGRGYYSEQEFQKLTAWMSALFAAEGCAIAKVYFSPYHPEHGVGEYKRDAACRKPGPGMIIQAAREFDVDLAASVLVGDRESDISAGIAAKVGCNLLFSPAAGPSRSPAATEATAVVGSLAEVIPYLR